MKRLNSLMIASLVLVLVLSLVGGAVAAPAAERVEVLIGFHGQPNPGLVRAFGGEVLYEFSLIPTVHAMLPAQAVAALSRHPSVRYMEPNGEVWAHSTQQVPWGIDRVFGDETYSFGTWKVSTGTGIGVAVLDTGIAEHVDLPVIAGGTNTVDTSGISDGHGHGTHVAGTIAAVDNNIGVVGVAPGITLYAVKVLSDGGSGSDASVAAGIDWVVAQNTNSDVNIDIRVINMSLGSSTYSQTLKDACDAAYTAGVLLVSSAGNSGNPAGRGDNVGYPARYPSVIAVAASDSSDIRASFSSTGPDVELIAPGVSILSTYTGGHYATASGTSMASPHVAGVAALVWAAEDNLTAAEVRTRLRETAENLGLSANHQGYGLVRADLAVGDLLPTTYTVAVSANPAEGGTVHGVGTYVEGTQATVTATAKEGYTFVNWTEGGTVVHANAEYTFTVEGDRDLVANFEQTAQPTQFTVTLSANPTGSGSVEGGGAYDAGTEVTVNATAKEGYTFVNWTENGTEVCSDAAYAFTVDGDRTLVANFTSTATGGVVSVDSITYSTTGGRLNDRHLHVTIKLADGADGPVAGASVSIDLNRNDGPYANSTGTTGSNGTVTFSYNNAPSGTYTTTVTEVVASGLDWDEATPTNRCTK